MRTTIVATVALLLSTSTAICQSWTIGNAQIERKITFDPASGLFTTRLGDLSTHYDLSQLRSELPQNSPSTATDRL